MSRISRLLSEAGLRLKKGLGQHFLVNQGALQKIATSVGATQESTILEIGCGVGNLTILLAQEAGRVIPVELDERFRPLHEREFAETENIQFHYGDFMEVNLQEVLVDAGPDIHAVGNIPYSLTSPILFKLLASPVPLASICLLMQREVAQRIAASPGSKKYGILAAKIGVTYDAQVVFAVSPGSFLPAPKVHSALIRLTPRADGPLIADLDERRRFFNFVDAAFTQRRRVMAKVLAGAAGGAMPREAVHTALESLSVPLDARSDSLAVGLLVELFRLLGRPDLPSARRIY